MLWISGKYNIMHVFRQGNCSSKVSFNFCAVGFYLTLLTFQLLFLVGTIFIIILSLVFLLLKF